ncbi:peptidase [Arenimonas caeni]|uniref:Putative beta-barrel assembly-enhancing protease n=2 Tax=Arenimonas caeni TaxID=2058085 RepID=A0A2P6M731_9GAMM|nr:M48 family metalloprotease [Arenimonas caeni]PRH81814.1 peptidase [Arenimonas caeni]
MRILVPAALSLALALACGARAQDAQLPDIGSSAAEMIDPGMEAQYGAYLLYELRRMGLVIEDPLVHDWLQGMGYRLAAASDTPQHGYTFFMLRQREINAFATLGGYVGMNAGLVLTAEDESEVAGVMAHEVAHVSQRHVLRAYERAQKDQVPILLAMLGAIAASHAVGSGNPDDNSSSNASMAAVAGAMALMQQRQIDYTRSNESEADRIGIQTLARAGYDPNGMANFFERMQRANRGNSGGYQLPEYLRTHPVTSLRISETRQRAGRLAESSFTPPAPPARPSLLLPGDLSLAGGDAPARREDVFGWARERLRVLSAPSARGAVLEYEALARAPGARVDDAQRYGLALAQMRAGRPREAEAGLARLLVQHPGDLWLELAHAEAAALSRQHEVATRRFESLLLRHPDSRAVRLTYADALGERATAEAGVRAQEVLRPLLAEAGDDPLFQRSFARASELAGDEIRASEAYAEAAFLNGRAVDALNQLDRLRQREDLNYYQRARIEARMAAITPVVLEMRRQGITADRQRPDSR